MTDQASFQRERLAELVIERALRGALPDEDAEMRKLSAALGVWDDGSFERAASAVMLASLPMPLEPIPPHLRARLEATAPAGLGPGPVPARPSRLRPLVIASGWLAAAACLALAIWALRRPPQAVAVVPPVFSAVPPTPTAPAPQPTPGERRAELLASAKDIVRLAWKPAKDMTGAAATGDVVWSASQQRGYMRFQGLATNDPRSVQYQLWIFDKGRDAKYPVDGGVFDVPAGGEVVVPIVAKLRVDEPTLFAVTVERPGGVVVSDRKRIAVLASPG
jgi:hypothetical protein